MANGMEATDYEKKYRSLKRKYKTLSEEALNLSKEVSLAKKRIIRLHKERRFLLDKLLTYEHLSSDSDALSSSSSEDERPRKREKREPQEEERPRKRGRGDEASSSRSNGHSRRSAKDKDKERDKDDNIQLCVARGKDDRPCKSKALQGFKYCWHHAPLDPNSPFIFCQYVDANKRNAKKCNIPVAKDKPDPFCNYHIKLVVPKEMDNGNAENENQDTSENIELNVDEEEAQFRGDGTDDISPGEERSPEDGVNFSVPSAHTL